MPTHIYLRSFPAVYKYFDFAYMLEKNPAFVGQSKTFAHLLLSQLLSSRTERCTIKQWCSGRLNRWLVGIDPNVHVCFFLPCVWKPWDRYFFFPETLRLQRGRLNPKDYKGTCHGLNPSWQLSPTQPFTTPPGGMGERIGRVRVRKLMGWDKNSLIGKAKAAHTSKAKQAN